MDHFTIIPAVMLALFGCAVLLFDFLIFPDPRQRKFLLIFVALAEGFAGFGLYRQQAWLSANGVTQLTGFGGSVTVDGFGIFFNWIFLAAALLVAMASYQYLETAGEHHGEYYGLILLAQCGMYFLATGTDLVTLFIGLELMALCFYVMVGFLRGDKRSNEAAMKYLLLGAFSSGFLAYGFSVMYGLAGSTKLADITMAIEARPPWPPHRWACCSRSRWSPSTCGRRTPMRARLPPSPPTCRWLPRRRPSRFCCASSWARWLPPARFGSRCWPW
jgi:NADH-quinone oxidoreductase subunit N